MSTLEISDILENRTQAEVAELVLRQQRLERIADEAGIGTSDLLSLLESAASEPTRDFTDAELRAFGDAGMSLTGPEDPASGAHALVAGRAAAHRLITSGLSVEDAASRLKVTPTRVRQRIADSDIVTIRMPEGHVLPEWQFVGNKVVPGLARMSADLQLLHPLEVAGFMTRPCPDLVIDGAAACPRDWLATGGDADVVAQLIAALVRA